MKEEDKRTKPHLFSREEDKSDSMFRKELEYKFRNEFEEKIRELEQRQMAQLEELREREMLLDRQVREREKEIEKQRMMQLEELREREMILDMKAREREKEIENQRMMQIEELREREMLLDVKAREREKDLENEKYLVLEKLKEKEKILDELKVELQEEKELYKEESKQRIEETSSSYVQSAIDVLERNKSKFQNNSRRWMIAGSLSIAASILVAGYISIFGMDKVLSINPIDWPLLIYMSVKGLVVISLFLALSRYCFVLGKAYMHESLKNSERIHAINFGKFYLESFGVSAKWEDIKDAFEHWNISSNSAFLVASEGKENNSDSNTKIGEVMDSFLKFHKVQQELAKK